MATMTASRRTARTHTQDNREVYADTGRPVDESLGSHVVLWIVDNPEAWAKSIEVEGDAQLTVWPKRQRHIAEQRRDQAYQSAAQVRAEGTRRIIHTHCQTLDAAQAMVDDLRSAHPNPGVRYELAAITEVGACPDCHQPTILADGQWRHHTGRYPAECVRRSEPQPEPELLEGEFEINAGVGSMACGYCNQTVSWPEAALGYSRLTGFHMLGIEQATNTLVVLAEATSLTGQTVGLPHHCLSIPEELHRRYAPTTTHPR